MRSYSELIQIDEKIEMTPEMEYFSIKLKTLPHDYIAKTLIRTSWNQTGFDKKIDHESTKIQRHESLNVVLFHVFNLSYFLIVFQNFLPEKTRKYNY